MICPLCDHDNRPGAKFCDECGAKLFEPLVIDSEGNVEEEKRGASIDRFSDPASYFPLFPESNEEDTHKGYDEDPVELEFQEVRLGGDADEMESEYDFTDKFYRSSAQETIDLSSAYAAARAAQATQVIDKKAVVAASADALSGLDESSIDESALLSTGWDKGGTLRMPVVEGENQEQPQKRFVSSESDTSAGKGGKKRALIIALVALIVAGCAAFGTWYLELWGGYKIPDVVALSQENAKNVITEKGFTVRVEQVKSDDEEGIVLLTDPKAGSRLPKGGEVVLHVSVSRSIPAIVGDTEEAAKKKMDAEGYSNVTYKNEKSNNPEGTVLSVNPEVGSKVKGAFPITVVIAESFKVPEVSGMTRDAAIAALQEEGYEVSISKVYSEEATEGTVLASSPAAGEKLKSGETVTISVVYSRGSELKEAANAAFAPGNSVTVGGWPHEISSLESVTYDGGDTTTVTVIARIYGQVGPAIMYLDPQRYTWSVHWTADNSISSIS